MRSARRQGAGASASEGTSSTSQARSTASGVLTETGRRFYEAHHTNYPELDPTS